jgi:23S rRNA (cytosine1962-C5)-methyltransferase
MAIVRIQRGHVQPLWAGHPWVFAQAIAEIEGAPAAGDVVQVMDSRGNFLGKGYYSPGSAIPVRILSRDPNATIDSAWLTAKIESAAAMRRNLLTLPNPDTTGFRLVHAEGDGLPGLVVDVFDSTAAVQLLTIGMKRREADVFAAVARVTGAKSVIEVASPTHQKLEGFVVEGGVVRGPDVNTLKFRENGIDWEIDRGSSQKTGSFFDQRDNRRLIGELCRGKRVLDAYCYTGAFSLAALTRGATSSVAVDRSAASIAAAAHAAHRAGVDKQLSLVQGDAGRYLRDAADRKETFDVVILDPPKLAKTTRDLNRARKAYRQINALALRVVARGGLLVTCSCSGAMRRGDFLRTIGTAAGDARREVQLLWLHGQGADHPVPPAFAEGSYLKCAVLKVE